MEPEDVSGGYVAFQDKHETVIEEEDEEEEEKEDELTDNATKSRKMNKFVSKTKRKCAHNFENQLSLLRNKPVMLLLVWNMLVFGYQFTILRLLFGDYSPNKNNYWLTAFPVLTLFFVFSNLLYPLAGWLTDTQWGRYRVMKYSIWLMWMSSVVALISRILVANYEIVTHVMEFAVLAINTVALAGFNVNIILFGIDHLTDASTDQSRAFIRWYYWTRNISVTVTSGLHIFLCRITAQYNILISIIITATLLSMAVGSDFIFSYKLKASHKKANPFILIRRVLFYTIKHSSPEYRSAFTYNESYHPKRIDFAKNIYGGPFRCDQVEDVKTFLNMFKAIIAIGIFSFLFVLSYSSTGYLIKRIKNSDAFQEECFPSDNIYWTFNSLVICILIPLFEFLLFPCLDRYIPRTLRRVGIAVGLVLIALFSLLVLELVGAIATKQFTKHEKCQYFHDINTKVETNGVLDINIWTVLIPVVVSTVAEMLGEIAAFEFICAQSPDNFKGFMMGLLFAVEGVFNGLASMIIIPFTSSQNSNKHRTIHCPGGYFSLQIFLGLLSLILYIVVVRQYQQREREPVANERQLVETHFEHMFNEREKSKGVHQNIFVNVK